MRCGSVFLAILGILGGCSVDNPGVAPPDAQINFPIAIALAPSPTGEAPSHLFLASSNFDLRYNAGSVQSFDLADLENALAGCSATAPCAIEDLGTLLTDEVFVGSHAAGMAVSPNGDRLYLAVRSDTNLTFIDVDGSGGLSCGDDGGRCSEDFRRGNEAVATERGIALPGDPVGVVATTLDRLGNPSTGDVVLMAHRTGRVSLFLEQAEGPAVAPVLVHVVSGLPEGLVNIALDRDGFAWTPSSNVAQVGRVGVAIDSETSDLMDSFLFDLGALGISGIDTGSRGDTRDVTFDPRPDVDVAYLLSRRPEAVLIADRANARPGDVGVVDAVPIGIGPSRIDVAEIDVAPEGSTTPDPRVLVFASCFDTREVWIVDPDLGEAVSGVRGLSGPFELAIDVARRYLYIVDFRASVVRVADLSPMLDCLARDMVSPDAPESCEPAIIGWLGRERPVGELL